MFNWFKRKLGISKDEPEMEYIDIRSSMDKEAEVQAKETLSNEDEEFALTLCDLGRKHMDAYNSGDKESDDKIWEKVERIGDVIKNSGGTERMTLICYRVEQLGGDMRYIQFVWWG